MQIIMKVNQRKQVLDEFFNYLEGMESKLDSFNNRMTQKINAIEEECEV